MISLLIPMDIKLSSKYSRNKKPRADKPNNIYQ